MIHTSVESLERALGATGVSADGPIKDTSALRSSFIDDLIRTAVFSEDSAVKDRARDMIHELARRCGAVPASIQTLYDAMGRGEVNGFTVPAHNIRALTYDTCRALFRAAMKNDVGPFIFEIARSEIGYTEQRPAEYASCVLAAAIKEGYRGPVFIQGDHFQASAKRFAAGEKEKELRAIESLIDEAIAAEFFNIDIDTSTLVDLSFPTVDEQQRPNYENAAHFTRYIRERQPEGTEISVGGEIGEVGKDNTTPEEFRAYMGGFLESLGSAYKGISKVSIQTGTSHGGVPLPDGTIAEASIDFETLRNISRIAREEYGLSGAVQHGASTLPETVFDEFPKSNTAEIHLATGFQNMVYDHPSFPAELKQEIASWCGEHCADERKKGETEEQFIYKSRKKALGPFKRRMWDLGPAEKDPIIQSLEDKFSFLFGKLGVANTRGVTDKYFPESELAAGSWKKTAAPQDLSEIPEGEGE